MHPAPSVGVPTRVPFVDLAASHDAIRPQLLAAIDDLIARNEYTNGPEVATFEESFAEYCGTPECVGVASGLDALRLALLGAGLEPGDEVIVPANTFVATLEAVSQAGGTPVIADVATSDYNLDPVAAEAAVSPRTTFLLPVHLYGQLADLRALGAVAERHGVRLLEDACQAHGSRRDGFRAGTVGFAGAFSFYPGKNLGAMGDAGAVVTADGVLAERVRALREHGQTARYRHEFEGWTARPDTIQAIVLLLKLPLLDMWNAARRSAAAFYSDALAGVGDLRLPPVAPGSEPVWHLYVVRTANPQRLADFLSERGIATGRHYPEPVHLSPAYGWLGHAPGSFPVAESLAAEVLSLPLFPGISENQLTLVVEAVTDYFRG